MRKNMKNSQEQKDLFKAIQNNHKNSNNKKINNFFDL